ncbi:hypothetical protein GCM10011512_04700 [Tersicoccus solisilvae]|uniref:DUF4244 domain-containing protein n=1 Tax=Tersicoccus solisilvae TaxID=1882339 RepID=A0ABQ1NNH2_9MICC|nr:DUF4244 domain-containing protein [Tersicoccus solisilvae]GGC80998.1 hypothetical protein GCM10011512_04700 [Tersicoccus solisilvae]
MSQHALRAPLPDTLLADYPGARRSSLEDGPAGRTDDTDVRRVIRLDEHRARRDPVVDRIPAVLPATGDGGDAADVFAAQPRRPARGSGRRRLAGAVRRALPALVAFCRRIAHGDAGMATAEYAIATLAAVGFAGLLVLILKGNEVRGLLTAIIRQALGG